MHCCWNFFVVNLKLARVVDYTKQTDLGMNRICIVQYWHLYFFVRATKEVNSTRVGRARCRTPQDKLMRYHGWSLNDKNPAVRVLALQVADWLIADLPALQPEPRFYDR